MAENKSSKVCEAEENACKRDVQALCYHCSKNLCRVHLMQHAQLIEEKTRAELQSLTDQFNELSSRFNQLSISDDILNGPLAQLEKWRTEAYAKIDQIVENKGRELHDELDKYRKFFLANKEEQLAKLNANKKTLAELIEESDATSEQIANLQKSVDEIETYLNALNAPAFNVIAQPSNWSVDIYTTYSDAQATSPNEIREFKIIYVRLNGIIRNYYVKTKKNGIMVDLIKSFVRQYTAIEEANQSETDQIYTIDHLPKSDFILPVEVYNHRIDQQYNEETILNSILERNIIVFYETPCSLKAANNPRILMPCLFQSNPTKRYFGLPIYLSVPRKECRGADVRNALYDTLSNFYKPNRSAEYPFYDACLQIPAKYYAKRIKLDDALEDEFDFMKESMTLIVAFDSQYVNTNNWSYFKQLRFL
jgi:hypothetical protein